MFEWLVTTVLLFVYDMRVLAAVRGEKESRRGEGIRKEGRGEEGGTEGGQGETEISKQLNELTLIDVNKAICGQQRRGKGYVVRVREVVVQGECLLPVGVPSPDHHNQDQNHSGGHHDGLGFR